MPLTGWISLSQFLTMLFITLAVSISTALYTRGISFSLLYFLFLIVSALTFFAWRLRNEWHRPLFEGKTIRRSAWALAAILGLGIMLRADRISHWTIWLDEYTQACSATYGYPNAAIGAANQEQPPLDYFLNGVPLHFIGFSNLGTRLHALILGCGAIPLFYLLCLRITSSRSWATFGALLFAGNLWLIRYSQEGRPVACGVFFAIFYFLALADAIRRELSPSVLAAVTVSALLFLEAIGLQPALLIASTTLAMLPFVTNAGYGRKARALILAQVAAVLLHLPIQYGILMRAAGKGKFHSDWLTRFGPAIATLRLADFGDTVLLFGPYAALAVTLLFLSLLLPLISTRTQMRKIRSTHWYFIDTAVLCLLFPALVTLFMKWVIDWPLRERYYLSILPAAIALVAWSARIIEMSLSRKWRATFRGVVLGAAVVSTVFSAQASLVADRSRDTSDYPSVYKFFREEAVPGSVGYMLNFGTGDWFLKSFPFVPFYYLPPGKQPVRVLSLTLQGAKVHRQIIEQIESGIEPPMIYFVNTCDFNGWIFGDRVREEITNAFPHAVIRSFPCATVIGIPNEGGFAKTMERFLGFIVQLSPDRKSIWANVLLSAVYIGEGDAARGSAKLDDLNTYVHDQNIDWVVDDLRKFAQ